MKKLIAVVIAILVFTGASPAMQNEVSAKTTCKTSKYKKICYYFKGSSKTYYKRITTIKHKNKKNRYREYVYRNSNGIKTSVKRYYYNKRGQLKSNKYGNAYRKYYTYFSNNKVAKYYKHKYKSNGKFKRIYYKYYSKNKPKPVVKKPTPPTQAQLNIMSKDIISMVNAERKKRGIPLLTENSLLSKGASIRAKELRTCWGHYRPSTNGSCDEINGPSIETVFTEVNYLATDYSENIITTGKFAKDGTGRTYARYGVTSKELYDAWYKSIGHRDTMLSSNYNDIGIAIYLHSDGTYYATQLFGTK